MNRTKGFTLIELLVVIAIIGLLLAILIPSLKRAKDFGMRILCASHLRSFGEANEIYTNQYSGAYVPIRYRKVANGTPIDWIRNDGYRAILDFESLRGSQEYAFYDLPDKLLCPADKIGKDLRNASSQYRVLTSYGYNATDWGWNELAVPDKLYFGHKVSTIKIPGSRLAFADAIDWWIDWPSANYEKGWDLLGQATIDEYAADPYYIHGPVIYRHSEGVNIGYYDGHVGYLPKEKVFISDDWKAYPKRPSMWVVDLELFRKRY